MSCAGCGTENPAEARFCMACGAALGGVATSEFVAGLRVARLGDRLLALILDTTLLAAFVALLGVWAAGRWGSPLPGGAFGGRQALVAAGAVVALAFLYHWLFEALFGATLGKAIVGVKVADIAGRACGVRRSLLRNLLRLVDGLPLYLIGFLVAVSSRKRQRLGDHAAGTYVLEKGGGRLWRLPLTLVWAAVIAAAVVRAGLLPQATPLARRLVAAVSPEAGPATPSAAPAEAGSAEATAVPTAVLVSGALELSDFAFRESEEGPVRAPRPFEPRERLFASFQAAGLGTDAQGQIHIGYGVEVLDPNGLLVQSLSKELDGAPGSSNTATISVWFDIPLYTPPGTAKLRVMARDEVEGKDGEIVASFVIDSKETAVSRRLELRDLRLAASEGGPPLEPAVIAPGATIYTAGRLAGMQFRDDRVDVAIAFQVVDPQGRTVMDKPDFLSVQDSFAYHPPTFFVPITAHLSLPADAEKGRYLEKYVVTDRIGGATRTYELPFELR